MFALRQLNQFEACSNAGFSKKHTKLPGEGSPAPAQDRSRPGAGVCEARAARRGRCARTAPASVAGRRAAGSRSIAARWHGHGHVARSVHARAAETRCRVSEVLWSGHRPPLPPRRHARRCCLELSVSIPDLPPSRVPPAGQDSATTCGRSFRHATRCVIENRSFRRCDSIREYLRVNARDV